MAFNNPYMTPMQNYGQYNALAPYQQRLDQMQQQWGQQQPVQQMQPQAQPFAGIKGKPVASEDEAKNTIIDMDGSVFFFPDFANNCIYTKQMNPETFAPIFRTYKIAEAQPRQDAPQVDMTSFVPRTDFDALAATVAALQAQIEQAATTQSKRASKEESK